MRQRFDFNSRKVLLTGATRGIGRALVDRLAARGALVLATGRDPSAVALLVRDTPAVLDGMAADLGEIGAAQSIADWVKVRHPDTSVVINNAAIMNRGALTGAGQDHLEAISTEIAVNLRAPLALSVALLPVLHRHSGAAIVNVTSGLAIAPRPDAAVYCATKAGLRSFTRALRDQCRRALYPIQVTEVVMTLVDTGLTAPVAIRKYPPERAAADLVRGVEAGLEEVWVEKAKHLRLVHRLSPKLAYRIMRAR
ncbi:MAG: SDR family NAD(P)-dependent oxidoreductase [Pararhodobacter sp.]|nr:SDR family NAD(P)-dependent oxidoreductase [Pararhodobacter sp.]